jgi:ubiquinone/menaquinone biosynthesis C-methylase UbiE
MAGRAPARTLTREEARRVYDRIGAAQDTQAFYEDRATRLLIRHGAFERARRVLELGCGTGRLAFRLLSRHLPEAARYRGLDSSPRMVELARERLAPFASRAEVVLTDGAPPVSEPAGSCDRFVASYVLDLLSGDDIVAVLRAAHRILEPGGLLCLAGLSTGTGPLSRLVARAWLRVHALRPAWVGGCRPLELRDRVGRPEWHVRHHAKLAPFGIPSEALVAERLLTG